MLIFDDKSMEQLIDCFGKDENNNKKSKELITKIFNDVRLELPIGKLLTKLVSTSIMMLDQSHDDTDPEVFNTIYNMQMYYLFDQSGVIGAVSDIVSEMKVKTKVHPDFTDSTEDKDLVSLQILSGILYFIEKFTDVSYLEYKFDGGKLMVNIMDKLDPRLLKGLEGIVRHVLSEKTNYTSVINDTLVMYICGKIIKDLRFKTIGNINMPDDLSDIRETIDYLLEPTTMLLLL